MGKRVFRHQLGSLQQHDVLIYEETNPDITVSVSNTLSEEFVMVNVESTFKPRTNEVWVRNTRSDEAKFWLVQPMQIGVNYEIKHSGEFLYKLSNEDDGVNYSIKKIALPSTLKYLEEFGEHTVRPTQDE